MKCPISNGKGKVIDYVAERNCHGEWEKVLREIPCDKCQRKPMTNEEWFASLPTEEKARFLDRICYSAWGDRNSRFKDMADYTDWVEWLKEVHREE